MNNRINRIDNDNSGFGCNWNGRVRNGETLDLWYWKINSPIRWLQSNKLVVILFLFSTYRQMTRLVFMQCSIFYHWLNFVETSFFFLCCDCVCVFCSVFGFRFVSIGSHKTTKHNIFFLCLFSVVDDLLFFPF